MRLPDVEGRSFFARFKERVYQDGNKDQVTRAFWCGAIGWRHPTTIDELKRVAALANGRTDPAL